MRDFRMRSCFWKMLETMVWWLWAVLRLDNQQSVVSGDGDKENTPTSEVNKVLYPRRVHQQASELHSQHSLSSPHREQASRRHGRATPAD